MVIATETSKKQARVLEDQCEKGLSLQERFKEAN
jgi:hypothetical protein